MCLDVKVIAYEIKMKCFLTMSCIVINSRNIMMFFDTYWKLIYDMKIHF
jgi:hypothetical protein